MLTTLKNFVIIQIKVRGIWRTIYAFIRFKLLKSNGNLILILRLLYL